MKAHRRIAIPALATCLVLGAPLAAQADPQALAQARALLAAGNPKGAYEMLLLLQDKLAGEPEYDYLLGVASLDSGRLEDAIISFERVLALMPNHAGAQMDLARAYYAAGSYDLAESAFVRLRASNPPSAAQEAINRYLEAIRVRKQQTQAGWSGWGELGLGYDSNITGVPTDFGSAAAQAFNFSGIQATGNSIKRSAAFLQGGAGGEYSRPLSRGWNLFAGGEARGRAYRHERDFDSLSGEVHAGAARNDGANQWRTTLSYFDLHQQGAAPGEPQPTNDRRMGSLGGEWRHSVDTRTQVGASLQYNVVRFPDNRIENFDQVYVSVSWLHSFERRGLPMLYLTAFASDDKAKNESFDGVTKSKNLFGLRSYLQYSITPKLQAFNALAAIVRRDKDAFARSTEVAKGRDTYGEAVLGLQWQFRDRCALRAQFAYSGNRSNIDIYDFNRYEISSNIRCDVN